MIQARRYRMSRDTKAASETVFYIPVLNQGERAG